MLQEEFDRLMALFKAAAEGKISNVEEVFKESLAFFEKLKTSVAQGSAEDKLEAIKMMTKMYEQMMQETKAIAKKTGMTEEELAEIAKNPANFSKEQWEKFESSKGKMEHLGEDIVKGMHKKEGDNPLHKKRSTHDKDHWLKS
ncbi:MAG: hypothetical protein RLZZ453_934 [Chlamydiota bacterium]|jgi:hypothetical protein